MEESLRPFHLGIREYLLSKEGVLEVPSLAFSSWPVVLTNRLYRFLPALPVVYTHTFPPLHSLTTQEDGLAFYLDEPCQLASSNFMSAHNPRAPSSLEAEFSLIS